MIFGERDVDDARGTILAHSLTAGSKILKKGVVLTANYIDLLKNAGVTRLTVAELGPDDIAEDEAAARVARALAGSNVRERTAAARGRCDLQSKALGVLLVDEALIHSANRVDEAVTVATLAPWSVVDSGQAVATIKIIPYGVSAAAVEKVEALLAARPALRLAPFAVKRVGLISTTTPGFKESLIDKTRSILSDRLACLGSRFAHDTICRHRPQDLAAAIEEASAHDLDILLIMGAAATADRRDVVPEALVQAGGKVLRLGMPAEPGNLLMLGERDGRPVLGLPGCVRSPARNGFDWTLERLLADIPVTPEDIQGMGVGGYLKGTET